MTFNGVWQIMLSFPTEVKGGASCPSLDTMNNTENNAESNRPKSLWH